MPYRATRRETLGTGLPVCSRNASSRPAAAAKPDHVLATLADTSEASDAAAHCADGFAATHREAHPDADLLALCLRLIDQEEEWQRLWTACEEDGSKPDADRAFEDFSANTWPGHASNPEDLPLQLIAARPVTLAGLRELARAVLALEAASEWTNSRSDDMADIMLAVVRAAAGVERMPIGDGSRPQ